MLFLDKTLLRRHACGSCEKDRRGVQLGAEQLTRGRVASRAVALMSQPIPTECGVYYFEVEVVNQVGSRSIFRPPLNVL